MRFEDERGRPRLGERSVKLRGSGLQGTYPIRFAATLSGGRRSAARVKQLTISARLGSQGPVWGLAADVPKPALRKQMTRQTPCVLRPWYTTKYSDQRHGGTLYLVLTPPHTTAVGHKAMYRKRRKHAKSPVRPAALPFGPHKLCALRCRGWPEGVAHELPIELRLHRGHLASGVGSTVPLCTPHGRRRLSMNVRNPPPPPNARRR